MLRLIRRFTLAVLILILLTMTAILVTSREEYMLAHLYEMVFGSPDLGPVDFETLKRPQTPNTALACPRDFCTQSDTDFDPGIFAVSEEALRNAFTRMALSQPHVVPVYRHEQPGLPTQDRYVQRSARMQFPDTIDVRFIPLTETTSTLAVYSRSQIGSSDFGVNLKRIKKWTDTVRTGVSSP